MKKKSNTWIAAALLTIAATISMIYCLLEFRHTLWILAISCIVLLLSAFWLFLCLSRRQSRLHSKSIGEEQHERMNYEGMKLQGEELIRLVNTLGKGTYVYSKKTAEQLDALNKQIQSEVFIHQQLVNKLIKEETRIAKFQVKYGQEDTAKLIQALADNRNRLQTTLQDAVSSLPNPVANDSVPTDTASMDVNIDMSEITACLHEITSELTHMNETIIELQQQVNNLSEMPIYHQSVSMNSTEMNAPEANTPKTDAMASFITDMDTTEATAPEANTTETDAMASFITDMNTTEATAPEVNTAETDTLASFITDMDTAEGNTSEAAVTDSFDSFFTDMNPTEVPIAEEQPETIDLGEEIEIPATDTTPEEFIEPASEPETVTIEVPKDDNPNRQLSPEEIAALFASLG